MPKHFLMILLQCATEAAAEREHHLMNNSKSGRQDISPLSTGSEKIKKPKCKTTKEKHHHQPLSKREVTITMSTSNVFNCLLALQNFCQLEVTGRLLND